MPVHPVNQTKMWIELGPEIFPKIEFYQILGNFLFQLVRQK
jgi:hypothetical protein